MKPKLTYQDFEWAAKELDCEVACIRAVDAIESRGIGFYPNGHPTILFERHVFRKQTGGRFDKQAPDLSNPVGGGYGKADPTGGVQIKKYERAKALDKTAAFMACSWGRFQIMGFNYKSAGFFSGGDMLLAMERSELDQLKAFVNFIKNNKLDAPLREKKWAVFARRYNGPAYAKHAYDTKLAAAYKSFSP